MSARTLGELLSGLAELPVPLAARPVRALTLDSRAVVEGALFVALGGARSHGLDHAAAALRQGAVAVLYQPPLPSGHAARPELIAVADLRNQLGMLARRFHGEDAPALPVIGVTGTNGKTSTVQLLAQALDASALGPCGHIGTLGVGLGDWREAGERTTPDVLAVHAALAGLRQRGARAVAMEVSSHALDQGRVDGVDFAVAVFTNLTRDHLDYHLTMEAYGAAKARLFARRELAAAVINLDDAYGRALAATIAAGIDLWTTSAEGQPARLRAEDVRLDADGMAFALVEGGQRLPLRSPLLGRFNVDNLLAVAASLRALGLPLDQVAQRLQGLRPVAGRMNRIAVRREQPLVVVDYAHTPDALQQALHSLRAHTAGALFCVFGCGGERDRGKRPQMAAVAEHGADRIIVTDDNPRGENGDAIVAEILAGFAAPAAVQVQRDRAAAIRCAIGSAAANDTVLIAGKGHEPYQEIAGQRLPFDDAAVARACLEAAA